MPAKNIVTGQKVDHAKIQRARDLRRQMTPEEKILWQALRANRLGGFHFRRQQVIDGFIVDFYCHAVGLVVELDGGIHQQQADYDTERDQVLAARNLRVVRIRNKEIDHNLDDVLARLLALCQSLAEVAV